MKQILLIFACLLLTQLGYGQKLPLLKVGSDSRYIVTVDDEPFFWLGDTAWEMIHRLNREEVDQYLTDRANKGFTVIQTVVLAELDGLNTPNAYGEKPLVNNDPTQLNDKYFQHVDYVLKKAEKLGLYIGLLPTWGDKFNRKWGTGPEIFTPGNARAYGILLAQRYMKHNNLVWILGGDRALENETHYAVIRAMAQGIREVDGKHLITYHPVGAKRATDFLKDDPWLDLDMYQSGHSRTSREYSFVIDAMKSSPQRPVINGEARYENIPDRFWEEKAYGWLDDADARVSAYWSMIAGAAGYTYGCNDVWQMYEIGRDPVIQARTGWKAALQLPGSTQMGYMRQIFAKLPWQKMNLRQDLIVSNNPENESYTLCAMGADGKFAVAYTPLGNPVKIDLSKMDAERIRAWWFNPRSGKVKPAGDFETAQPREFTPWSKGWGSDFLLVLVAEDFRVDFDGMM